MKLHNLFLAAVAVAALASCQSGGVGKTSLKTDTDSLSYAFGIYYGENFQRNPYLKDDDLNYVAFVNGLKDGFSKDSSDGKMTPQEAVEFVNGYFKKLEDKTAADNLAKGEKFLKENKSKDGVIVDSTGIQYEVITEGTGARPVENDVVKVHYRGTLIDGTPFDASYDHNNGEPVQFNLNRVIKGWTIGLQKMKVGSKYKFYIPSHLAYGTQVRPGDPIGPNETLIFEVELLDIVKETK